MGKNCVHKTGSLIVAERNAASLLVGCAFLGTL